MEKETKKMKLMLKQGPMQNQKKQKKIRNFVEMNWIFKENNNMPFCLWNNPTKGIVKFGETLHLPKNYSVDVLMGLTTVQEVESKLRSSNSVKIKAAVGEFR